MRPEVIIDTLADAEKSGLEMESRNESRDVEITDAVVDNTNIGNVVVDDARMVEEHGNGCMADTGEKQLRDNDAKKEQAEKN